MTPDPAVVLRRRFPGLVFWFGRRTGAWWALIPPPGGWRLVEAADPEQRRTPVLTDHWRGWGHASAEEYPDELRERAVRMVFEVRERAGHKQGSIARVADQLGVNRETPRNWVRQAEIDSGQRPGISTADRQRIAELERENAELKQANEIPKAAASFFTRDLDLRLPN